MIAYGVDIRLLRCCLRYDEAAFRGHRDMVQQKFFQGQLGPFRSRPYRMSNIIRAQGRDFLAEVHQLTNEFFRRPDFSLFSFKEYLVPPRAGPYLKCLFNDLEIFFEICEERGILLFFGFKFYDCGIRRSSLIVLDGHKGGQSLVLFESKGEDFGVLLLSEFSGPYFVDIHLAFAS